MSMKGSNDEHHESRKGCNEVCIPSLLDTAQTLRSAYFRGTRHAGALRADTIINGFQARLERRFALDIILLSI